MSECALRRVYGWLLRLFPGDFREAFGDEMLAVFAERLHESEAWGWPALLATAIREYNGLLTQGVRERLLAAWARPALAAATGLGQEERIMNRRATLLASLGAAVILAALARGYTVQAVHASRARGVFAEPWEHVRRTVAANAQAGVYGDVVRVEFHEPEPYNWLWVLDQPDIQCMRIDIWTRERDDAPRWGGPTCYLRVQGGWSPISIETAVPPELVALLAGVFHVQ